MAKLQSASYGPSLRLAKLSPPATISTCTTSPSLSVALALTLSVAPTLTPCPALGELITTSGAVFGGRTVTLTAAELPRPSRSSITSALRTTSPASAGVHSSSYGASASSPITSPFARNLTFTTLPSESLALATNARVFPALRDVPASGWVSVTLGGWFAETGRSNLVAITLRICATSASLKARLYTSTSATAPPNCSPPTPPRVNAPSTSTSSSPANVPLNTVSPATATRPSWPVRYTSTKFHRSSQRSGCGAEIRPPAEALPWSKSNWSL